MVPAFLSGTIDGALYLLRAPLALCALLATCLLLASATRSAWPALAVVVVATATVARWLPVVEDARLVPGMLLVLGLLLAVGRGMGHAMVLAGAVVGGIATGIGGGMQVASGPEIAGSDAAIVAVLAIATLPMRFAQHAGRLARVAAVGRRMAGAWIAAIGALLLALPMRGLS
jgi:hypothetical protein